MTVVNLPKTGEQRPSSNGCWQILWTDASAQRLAKAIAGHSFNTSQSNILIQIF